MLERTPVRESYAALRVIPVMTEKISASQPGEVSEQPLVQVIRQPVLTIGRALTNTLVFMSPQVSREHVLMEWQDQGWRVTNLSEQNSVSINGYDLASGESAYLEPEDFLTFGEITVQLVAPRDEHRDALPEREAILQSQRVVHESTLSVVKDVRITTTGLLDHAEIQRQTIHLSRRDIRQFLSNAKVGPQTRRLFLLVGMLILGILALGTIVLFAITGKPVVGLNNITSHLAVIIPIVPPMVIALLVNSIDRFEREPWSLRLLAFLWGAIIAIPAALLLSQSLESLIVNSVGGDDLWRSILQALNAGVVEESVKGLGLLLLFFLLRDEFDNVTDGIIYGALIGAGFAMVENFFYFVAKSNEHLFILVIGRVMLGWLCHSTFTMCLGAALGYVRHTRVHWRRICIPLLGILIAIILHSVFDFVQLFANALVLDMPDRANIAPILQIVVVGDYIFPYIAQLFLLYVLIRALQHEAAVIREFLVSEVSSGVVRVDEYVIAQDSTRRIRLERQVLREQGVRRWLLVKAFYQAQINLAFRKWHSHMEDRPRLGYRFSEDHYRQQIVTLRGKLQHT